MAGTFRNGAYDALVEALKECREKAGMTQLAVAAALPKWLGLDHTMLNKIEHKTRNVSHIEVRELAKVLGTTVVKIDATAAELEAGRRHVPPAPTRLSRVRKRK